MFVCGATHPLARRKRLPLVDLAGQDLIQFPLGWGIRQRVDAGFAAVGSQPVSAFEVADYAIAAELIRHRLFIASAGPQFTNRAIDALTDTIARHLDQ